MFLFETTKILLSSRPLLKFLLKRVRKGIVLREEGKSLCVRTNDILRKRFWQLAELMVSKGNEFSRASQWTKKEKCRKAHVITTLHSRKLLRLQVKEGRLPEADLLFHLSLTEIAELLKTRSPKHLIRAIHRRTNQKSAASAIYPEHCAGLPLQAVRKKKRPLKQYINPFFKKFRGYDAHS